jgi:hypothetical protein
MRTPVVTAIAILLGCVPTRSVQASEGPAHSGLYSLEIVDDNGSSLPTFQRAGRTYVLGTLGQRYVLRVRNRSGQRIEVVASVDGRDVRDGRPAAWDKRGYLVDPYNDVTIDGYRLNQESVAAFRFSSVPRSYAAEMGSARDVGVIGVAVFTERQHIRYRPPPVRPDRSVPAPEEPLADFGEGGVAGGVAGGVIGGHTDPLGDGEEAPLSAAPNSGIVSKKPEPPERRGLGTEFAEEHASHIDMVQFERASSAPAAVLSLRYNDRAGLLALGIDVDGRGWYSGRDEWLRERAEPFRRNASFAQPPPGWRR